MGTSKGEGFRTKGWTDKPTRNKNCTPLAGTSKKTRRFFLLCIAYKN